MFNELKFLLSESKWFAQEHSIKGRKRRSKKENQENRQWSLYYRKYFFLSCPWWGPSWELLSQPLLPTSLNPSDEGGFILISIATSTEWGVTLLPSSSQFIRCLANCNILVIFFLLSCFWCYKKHICHEKKKNCLSIFFGFLKQTLFYRPWCLYSQGATHWWLSSPEIISRPRVSWH